MKEKLKKVSEIKTWYGDIPIYYRYTLGIAGERFFKEIKENARLMGTYCPKCDITYLPPKIYCENCLSPLDKWVVIPNEGNVHTYTILYEDLEGNPLKEPIIAVFVTFKGVEGGLFHRLEGAEPEEVYIGMPVVPLFKDKKDRKGDLSDILYFKPVE